MDRNKAQNYLNIANKAGYVIFGSDKLDSYKQKLYLVLYDSNAGKSSAKIASKLAEKGIKSLQIDNLGQFCGIQTCKILAIKNKNLSDLIVENLTN